MKYTGPKARRCRRQGTNIYQSEKYDRVLQRKPYGPGKNPRSRRGKVSEYGEQLLEKQKVRDTFLLSERQFRRYYTEALRSSQATGQRMMQLLETRLDNALFRAGFAVTRPQARQMAGHGLFLVNKRRTNRPSCLLVPGDVVEARPHAASSALFVKNIAATEKHIPPPWLKVHPQTLTFEVVALPQEEHVEHGLDVRKVVELYSR